VPQVIIAKDSLGGARDLAEFLSETTKNAIFTSKGEAKRMIAGGGVMINKQKIADPLSKPELRLLKDKYLLIQKGKKNYHLVIVE
jgi:tyrosyl-tRNA synthetase